MPGWPPFPLGRAGDGSRTPTKRGALSAPFNPTILLSYNPPKKPTESRFALSPPAHHPCCTPQPDTLPHSTVKYPVFLVLA